jgi:CheY-like chemotaxis protein
MTPWVLVIDDDQDNRELLAELIESAGYEVASCGSGIDAATVLDKRGKPCVVLADVLMPDMHGTAFVESMKRRPGFEDTPVIFVTGANPSTLAHIEATVLRKPYDLDVLLDLVSRHCGSDAALPRTTPPRSSEADPG